MFCLNGAAARKAQVGDKIIIVAYALMSEEESKPLMHEFLFENNLCYYSIHE